MFFITRHSHLGRFTVKLFRSSADAQAGFDLISYCEGIRDAKRIAANMFEASGEALRDAHRSE